MSQKRELYMDKCVHTPSKNGPLLAKIGVDTNESEPILKIFGQSQSNSIFKLEDTITSLGGSESSARLEGDGQLLLQRAASAAGSESRHSRRHRQGSPRSAGEQARGAGARVAI